jgi:hypothetical protein
MMNKAHQRERDLPAAGLDIDEMRDPDAIEAVFKKLNAIDEARRRREWPQALQRKMVIVVRLLRGEPLELVARGRMSRSHR